MGTNIQIQFLRPVLNSKRELVILNDWGKNLTIVKQSMKTRDHIAQILILCNKLSEI